MQNERRQAERFLSTWGAIAGAPTDVKVPPFQLSRCRLYGVDSALLAQTHAIPSGIVFTGFPLSFSFLPFLSFLALSRVADRPLFSVPLLAVQSRHLPPRTVRFVNYRIETSGVNLR